MRVENYPFVIYHCVLLQLVCVSSSFLYSLHLSNIKSSGLVFTYYFLVRIFRCASGMFEQLTKCLTNESRIVFYRELQKCYGLFLFLVAKKKFVWINTMKQKIFFYLRFVFARVDIKQQRYFLLVFISFFFCFSNNILFW